MIYCRALNKLLAALKDHRGVAAVEFALLAPILIILLIGTAETVTSLNHSRKVDQVTSTVSDLVAQVKSVSSSDLNDIMKVSSYIMYPYSSNGLKIIVASVTFDDKGKPTTDWFKSNSGSNMGWARHAKPPFDIPESLVVPNSSIVVSQTSYTHVPMFASLAQNLFPRAASISMGDVAYMIPRVTNKVQGP
ncbi:MAG: pilus assembly protein [Rhodobacteraceae bacterium]|nr:pilus assembly protein [Paracoccaceae bacterium]